MNKAEAVKIVRNIYQTDKEKEALETLIPELKESEDERMYARVTERYTRIEKYYLRALGETEANKVLKECEEEELWIKDLLEKLKEQKPAEWKPRPESLEALMYAIVGKWEMIKPTSYLSRMLEDLYDGLVNTYSVDESLLAELPKTVYTAEDIEELRALKAKIEASMEGPITKPAEKQGYTDLNDLERAILRGFLAAGVENVPVTIIKETAKECLAQMKPEAWSEEEEEKITFLERLIRYNVPEGQYGWVDGHKGGSVTKLEAIAILKSLRPSWKPSEEQMDALKEAYESYDFCDGERSALESLYNDLKKL